MKKKDVMANNMKKEVWRDFSDEEIELWSVTNTTLKHMAGFCFRSEMQCVSEEQKTKLADQRWKYAQKADFLTHDMAENNRILNKYSPLIKENKVMVEFLLNDEIDLSEFIIPEEQSENLLNNQIYNKMEKKDVTAKTDEELELWDLTSTGLHHMVGYCNHFKHKGGLTEEQLKKLREQSAKYTEMANFGFSLDIEKIQSMLEKYSPLIKEDKVTLEFLLHDEI